MVFEEKSVLSEQIYKGKIITLRVDTVAMPEGRTATREIVDHPGGVGIVPITDNGEIIMVKQFRKPVEKALLEIPAGKLDNQEAPYICGVRELEEETGYKAHNFVYLGHFFPTPGFANETTHLYMADNLYKGQVCPDEDEYLDIELIPMAKVIDMIMNNEINDAKTIIGIFKARELLNKEVNV